MREAIEAYIGIIISLICIIDLMETGENEDMTLQDVLKEHHETQLTPQEVTHFRGQNTVISLFLKKQGKRKIWKADRFTTSRRVKIAESFDQLIG